MPGSHFSPWVTTRIESAHLAVTDDRCCNLGCRTLAYGNTLVRYAH